MSVEKTCIFTWKKFVITEKESEIRLAASPVIWWITYPIDEPNHHPDIDHQRHLAWRNERTLYRSTCDLTWKSLITSINPQQWYTVYNFYDRWSDKRDPFDYWREISFDKSFTEQFSEMYKTMPQMSLNLSLHMENCDYCNYGLEAKSCYMCTTPIWSENCYYSYLPFKSTYDLDWYANTAAQRTYWCVHTLQCFECSYCFYSDTCKYSSYLLDCVNCEYCFGCVNLSNKKYHIFNKEFTKEEYDREVKKIRDQFSWEELLDYFHNFSLQHPRRAVRSSWNENAEWDLLFNTNNIINSFDAQDCADCVECRTVWVNTNDLARCTLTWMATRIYSSTWGKWWDASAFHIWCNNCIQTYYSFYCRDCSHCFWCVRLKNKEYCIFNKQYTKEEYEELLPKLIVHMKNTSERSLPLNPSISQFPYNDTCSQERFPWEKESIEKQWRLWIDQENTISNEEWYIPKDINRYNTPEKIKELTSSTIICSETKRPFKIIEQQFLIHKKLWIPLPTKHHEKRYQEQIALWKNPRELFKRTCDKTWVNIKTSYSKEREEIVWSCEEWDKEFRW